MPMAVIITGTSMVIRRNIYRPGDFKIMKRLLRCLCILTPMALLTACGAEVGSKKWCEGMESKPKGDWSANEAKDYAKHCVFK